MKAKRYVPKEEDTWFGDESVVALRQFIAGEISEVKYDMARRRSFNEFYRSLLKEARAVKGT